MLVGNRLVCGLGTISAIAGESANVIHFTELEFGKYNTGDEVSFRDVSAPKSTMVFESVDEVEELIDLLYILKNIPLYKRGLEFGGAIFDFTRDKTGKGLVVVINWFEAVRERMIDEMLQLIAEEVAEDLIERIFATERPIARR